MTSKIPGARAIIKCLEDLHIDTVFGLPGGAVLSTFDEINENTKFRFILTRHEQGAGHGAQGYALATGKPGVVLVTSGPGATNVVTPIADANADSVPMLVITGQVAENQIGTDAFQESDIVGITRPIVKHSYIVTEAKDITKTLIEAYHIASSGRPGPVLVDITKNAQLELIDYTFDSPLEFLGYNPNPAVDQGKIDDIVKMLKVSNKPLIYAGGGTIRSNSSEVLKTFIEKLHIPLVTTLQSRGVINEGHSNNLSMVGMHGSIAATGALQNADLVIVLGARLSDRVTGDKSKFAPNANFIQIDIDASEFNKNRISDLNIQGDITKVLTLLNYNLDKISNSEFQNYDNWWKYIDNLREKYPFYHGELNGPGLNPSKIIQRISELTHQNDQDTVYAVGVGQHQMWASQFINHNGPRKFLSSGGLGTMGFGVPAGFGAKAGLVADGKDTPVWIIDGDGCFQMTNQELVTAQIEKLPVKVALINNSTLGMPRQWQSLFFDKHYAATDLHDGIDSDNNPIPDFVKLAQAYGCLGIRVTKEEEIDDAINLAINTNDKSVVIDFVVNKDAKVFPMVRAGGSNFEVMYKEGVQPLL